MTKKTPPKKTVTPVFQTTDRKGRIRHCVAARNGSHALTLSFRTREEALESRKGLVKQGYKLA